MVGYVNGRDWNESSGLFFCEKNKASIQVEDKTGREGVDLAFAIAEIGEEIGFTQGGVIHLVTPSLALGLFRKNEISGNKQDNRSKIWYDKF